MATLTRVVGTQLFTAYDSRRKLSNFLVWPAEPQGSDHVDLSQLWRVGGVFLVADEGESPAGLARFAESLWNTSAKGRTKVLAWKSGTVDTNMALDENGVFKKGHFGLSLFSQWFGAIEDESVLLNWKQEGADPRFWVECVDKGLEFFCSSKTQIPFACTVHDLVVELWVDLRDENKLWFCQIPVSDLVDGSGAWEFQLTQDFTTKTLAILNPQVSLVREVPPRFLKADNYPLFDFTGAHDSNGSRLRFRLHPYSLRDTHSRMDFAGGNLSLTTNFVDAAGRSIGLASGGNSYFTLMPTRNYQGNPTSKAVLSSAGTFSVQFSPTTTFQDGDKGYPAMEVLTGTTGTDFVLFGDGTTSDLPNAITFDPAGLAFIEKDDKGIEHLTDKHVTAWIHPTSTKAAKGRATAYRYVSQPEPAPFFGLKGPGTHKESRSGARQDQPGLEFDPAPRLVDQAMPWIPFRGVAEQKAERARMLDRHLLASQRNKIAAESHAKRSALIPHVAQKRWVVMPQGFSVLLDSANQWQQVIFGKSSGDVDVQVTLKRPENDDGKPVARWPIQEALTRSATFMVVTQLPKEMPSSGQPPKNTIEKISINIQNWKAEVEIGKAEVSLSSTKEVLPPLLVIKLGGGKFTDLVADVKRWSLPAIFNAKLQETQVDLDKAVKSLERLSEGVTPYGKSNQPISEQAKEGYRRIYERLNDPAWNGLVLFNAFSKADQLPEAVCAMGGGVPKGKKFWVPCIGIDLCKVTEELTVQEIEQKPSVFAGIHYYDDSAFDPKPGDYRFDLKLRNLDVVIDNSTVQAFAAKAELLVCSLLGVIVKHPSDPKKNYKIITINGTYSGRSSAGSDQYVIRALGEHVIDFSDGDGNTAVIKSIKLARLEVSSSKQGSAAEAVVTGRFSMWGDLTFGAGVTSFTGVKQVTFENLAVIMTRAGDGATSFTLDAGKIGVDWDGKKIKSENGWWSNFPLRLSGIRWGGTDFWQVPRVNWPDLGKCPNLRLPDMGFAKFDMPGFETGDGFDFAMELNLDLGGFGSFVDAAKLLTGKLLIGWYDFRRFEEGKFEYPKFSLGFKFEGGSAPLDIGIQGIFRLKAEKVILKTYGEKAPKLIGFGLVKPQLEVLGYTVISEDDQLRLAIVAELGESRTSSPPTWVLVFGKGMSLGPVVLDYFAVGQNATLIDPKIIPDIHDVPTALEKSKEYEGEAFAKDDLQRFRLVPNARKWSFLADGKIQGLFDASFVFLDDQSLYGVRVALPSGDPWISVDALYKKLDDHTGVFEIEVDLKGLRTIDLGGGSLTLPVIGFAKYTNSGYVWNVGYDGNNFSKSGTLQVLPFLGSAGLRFGQLSGVYGNILGAGASEAELERLRKEYGIDRIYELQTAFRVGLGKEMREGIFRAGASISVYGIFQGALAPTPKKSGRYLKIAGAAGILLEIFGEVNFSLVSAAVAIRVWVEMGLVIETGKAILIYAEAGVQVYVRFVIARFRIFGKTIEIAVEFSFSTRVRIQHQLDGIDPVFLLAEGEQAAGVACDPINWQAVTIDADTSKRARIPVVVSWDMLIDDHGEPVLVPFLALLNPTPQGKAPVSVDQSVGDLVILLFRWAVRLSLRSNTDPAEISLEDLDCLADRLRSPSGQCASRWNITDSQGGATSPLEVGVIKEFFRLNIIFVVSDAKDLKEKVAEAASQGQFRTAYEDDRLHGIVMPWLRELEISASSPSGNRPIRRFTDSKLFDLFDQVWENKFLEKLRESRPSFCTPSQNSDGRDSLAGHFPSDKKQAALDILLEDWTMALIEGVVHRSILILRERCKKQQSGGAEKLCDPIKFSELLASLQGNSQRPETNLPPVIEVAQHACAVLMQAIRAPLPPKDKNELTDGDEQKWVALTELAGLEVGFGADRSKDLLASDTGLKIDPVREHWLEVPGDLIFEFEWERSQVTADKIRLEGKKLIAQATGTEIPLSVGFDMDKKVKPFIATCTKGLPYVLQNDKPQLLGRVFQVPDELSQLQRRQRVAGGVPKESMIIYLKGVGDFENPDFTFSTPDQQRAHSFNVADVEVGGQFKVKLRRVDVPQGAELAGRLGEKTYVYGISGVGETGRLILQSWKNGSPAFPPPEKFEFVLNPSGGKLPSSSSDGGITVLDRGIQLFLTNLSTEAHPDSPLHRSAVTPQEALKAVFDFMKPDEVRQFLWQASVVNEEGFYLQVDPAGCPAGAQVLDKMLGKESSIEVGLTWVRKAFSNKNGVLHPYESFIRVLGDVPDKWVVCVGVEEKTGGATKKKTVSYSTVPDGFVDLCIRPQRPLEFASLEPAANLRSKFSFVEYGVSLGAQTPSTLGEQLLLDHCTPIPPEVKQNDSTKPLAGQEPEKVRYRLLLPLLNYAKPPDGQVEGGKPERLVNPYALIGVPLGNVISFGMRDGAGHRFSGGVTATWDKPQEDFQRYRDAMKALHTYPGMNVAWSAGSPLQDKEVVRITLSWKLGASFPAGSEAGERAYELYRKLLWSLQAKGVAVMASLEVDGVTLHERPQDIKATLIDFVKAIVAKLKPSSVSRKAGATKPDLEKFVDLDYPQGALALKVKSHEEPAKLEVVIRIVRDESLCDTDVVQSTPEVQEVVTQIAPASTQEIAGGMAEFAGAFEAGFKDIRLLGLLLGDEGYSLWVINEQVLKTLIEVEREIGSYAPQPLRKTFQSGVARVRDFNQPSVDEKSIPVSDVDMDVLANTVFHTIELMLAPDVAAAMSRLDSKSFNTIMNAKQAIVAFYASGDRLSRIEQVSALAENAGDEVRSRFKGLVSKDLRLIYQLGSICAVQPKRSGRIPGTKMRIYGEVKVVKGQAPALDTPDTNKDQIGLSPIRIPLDGEGVGTFSIAWKGAQRPDAVTGNRIILSPRYIECPWPGVLEEYVPSRWFELLSEAARGEVIVKEAASLVLPLPLRFLPKPPNVFAHAAQQQPVSVSQRGVNASSELGKARRWDYTLDVAVPGEEQDTIYYTIDYVAPKQRSFQLNATRTLFDALVTFEYYLRSIHTGIAKMREGTGSKEDCKVLANFVEDVRKGFGEEKPVERSSLFEGKGKQDKFVSELNSEKRQVTFHCEATAAGNNRAVTIELTDITRLNYQNPNDPTPSRPGILRPERKEPIDLSNNVNKSGYYQYASDVWDLPAKGWSGLSGRRLTVTGLDLFLHPVVVPIIKAIRNKEIKGCTISERFWFETEEVKAAESLIPRIRRDGKFLLGDSKKSLAEHLGALGDILFNGVNTGNPKLSMDVMATLVVAFDSSKTEVFEYPLGAMKGRRPKEGQDGWSSLLKSWAARLEGPLKLKSGQGPQAIRFSISVYADYAGDRPVLVLDNVWLPSEYIDQRVKELVSTL